MKKELARWDEGNGNGIDLEGWTYFEGNFSLAVGYATIFCPNFFEFEDYILLGEGEIDEDYIRNLRSFENRTYSTPRSVEATLNHFHIADLHRHYDLTVDKILFLGEALKAIYEARLACLFPSKPCVVEFLHPEDIEDLFGYQITFWQKKHESESV